MARFKKLSISKRILAIALSVMLVAMSIPVSTMLNVLAATSGGVSDTTLTISYDSSDQPIAFDNATIIQWLIDKGVITLESDLEAITALEISGDLDQDAYFIIDAVYDGADALDDVSVTTSENLSGSWLGGLTAFAGGSTVTNFDVTLDGATLVLADGDPDISSLTMNGGTLDIGGIVDLSTYTGISNLIAVDVDIVFPAGTTETEMEQFFADVNADLGGTITGTPQGGSPILLAEASVSNIVVSPDSFKNAVSSTSVTVTITGEYLMGQTIVISASGANAVTPQNALVAADGNSASATLSIPANTTGINQVYTISATLGGSSVGSGVSVTVVESVKPTVESITTFKLNAREGTLSITFSENMNTGVNGSVSISGTPLGTGSWAGRVYSVSYSGLSVNTGYSVSISGFEDANGNEIATGTTAGSFTTVNNAALLAAISDAESILLPTGTPGIYDYNNEDALYTDAAFNQLVTAYEAAIAVPMTADQNDINDATTTLTNALSALNASPGLGSLTVNWNSEIIYYGETVNADSSELGLIIKNGAVSLDLGTDYTVSFSAGDKKNVTGNDITITITGIGDYAAAAPITRTFKIIHRNITARVSVTNKLYDATNKANITIANPSEKVSGEDVNVIFKAGITNPENTLVVFNSVARGTVGAQFIAADENDNFELSGSDKDNYYLDGQAINGSPTISAWNITPTQTAHFIVSSGNNGNSYTTDNYGWYKQGESFVIDAVAGYEVSESDASQTFGSTQITKSSDTLTSGTGLTLYIQDKSNLQTGINTYPISNVKTLTYRIDTLAPQNLTIEYKENGGVLATLARVLTFGFFKSEITVELKATDSISLIDRFVVAQEFDVDAPALANTFAGVPSTISASSGDVTFNTVGTTTTATFKIAPQYRGKISFTAYDKAGNSTDSNNENDVYLTEKDGVKFEYVVLDNLPPRIDDADAGYVSYAPDRIVNNSNNDITTWNTGDKVEAGSVLYFAKDVVATITIQEENFIFDGVQDVVTVEVKKGVGGSYAQYSFDNTTWMNKGGDVYENTVTLPANANGSDDGDYWIKITYADRATNGVSYESQKLVIDRTAPNVKVEYTPATADINGGYFKARQAKITVTEHNFRADEIASIITIKDCNDNPIEAALLAQINSDLKNRSKWIPGANPDEYEQTIVFSADAYYTFDIGYIDLATNSNSIPVTYVPNDAYKNAFSVDNTPPKDLKIEYSNATLIDSLLETLTFGFYKTPVTVTLTATDVTAGMDYFNVVSTIDKASSTDDSGIANILTDKVYTLAATANPGEVSYSFALPAQYRGTISFTAFDKAGNSAASNDDSYKTPGKNSNFIKTVVVDDISPDATIEYTNTWADAVDASNNSQSPITAATRFVSSGEIAATIIVKEANFDLRDPDAFVVTMTRNGEPFTGFNFTPETWTETTTDTFVNNTLKIPASADGDYVITISFKDRSDNNADWTVNNENSGNGGIKIYTYTSNILTIDTTAPVIETDYVAASSTATGLPHDGIFDAPKAIKITVTDRNFRPTTLDGFVLSALNPIKTSPSEAATRYTVTGSSGVSGSYTESELIAALQNWSSWKKTTSSTNGSVEVWETTITFNADGEYSFKLNAKDIAGNVATESSVPVFIVDKTAPSKLEIKYDSNPFREFLNLITFNLFKNKVDVTIKATDNTSGVEFIEWQYVGVSGLDNLTAVNKSSRVATTRVPGTNDYTISFEITEQFKGDIKATAIDKADNRSNPDPVIDAIEIVDTKDPIITVTYPNDVAPSVFNGVDYYKADRTARIEITEDNFVDSTTQIIITRDGQPYSTIIPSSWTSNGTSHVKQLVFNEDGDYTFEVISKDIVGRESKVVEKSFTVDKTLPVIGVVYNNNDVRNGNYYKAERTATITITEHNFNAADVKISVTATDDGATIAAPRASAWSTNGDVHTATINYTADALYSFSIEYTDLAGNDATPFTPEQFYVDKTNPEITIENVSDRTAYGDVIQPVIKLFDINYGGDYTVTLRRVDVSGAGEDVYARLDKTTVNAAKDQGLTINFANIPTVVGNDGIYNLSVKLVDKAGNELVKTLTFSVNRFGSTYYFADEATKALADKTDGKRFTNVEIDIKIGEINVDPLAGSSITVSRNNDVVNELKEGTEYTVNDDSAGSGWYACVYDIKAANFSSEGFYTVIVTSTDTAEHTSKNTVPVAKGNELPVEFTVDKTKPELTIKNIESRRAYSDAERKITIESTDINLNCESLKVYLDGNEVTIDNAKLVPDQFGKLSVELTVKANKGQAQDLEVKILDFADNEQEATVTRFTLSANIFQLWYQNTLLFVLSLVGIAGISGGLFFLLWKRRKKNKAGA